LRVSSAFIHFQKRVQKLEIKREKVDQKHALDREKEKKWEESLLAKYISAHAFSFSSSLPLPLPLTPTTPRSLSL